ncbi:MAG TPA: hypothetical protein VIG33_11085, partial [Pseudobdellovibrionaceae bacterium]
MNQNFTRQFLFSYALSVVVAGSLLVNPVPSLAQSKAAIASNAAEKVYVAPGKYDEFYSFVSGGFSGQVSVYGLPSG